MDNFDRMVICVWCIIGATFCLTYGGYVIGTMLTAIACFQWGRFWKVKAQARREQET